MIRLFTILILILVLIPFITHEGKTNTGSRRVTVCGKILNYDSKGEQIKLVVNRLALDPEFIYLKPDTSGYFKTSFNIYIPGDVSCTYKSCFNILVHPGDSIYVEIDNRSEDILKKIKFSGDAAKTNQDAAAFQQIYFSNNKSEAMYKALKEDQTEEFLKYLDSIKTENNKRYKNFIDTYSPDSETNDWISTFINLENYYYLGYYPTLHQAYNNLNETQWNVPLSYYDKLNEVLPIQKSMFICTSQMNSFIGSYGNHYASNKAGEENKKYLLDSSITLESKESIVFNSMMKYLSDPLLKQLVFATIINSELTHSDISSYNKYSSLISEPYLKEPLSRLYIKLKEELENAKLASDAILTKPDNMQAEQIIDSIKSINKGKVIYIDCWATWCTPCLGEMPRSKELMKEFNGKDAAFVYLCFKSEEKIWKATLGRLGIGGQHYFLNEEQSKSLWSIFEINGVPFYILIDKNGNVLEKGSQLVPGAVREKITGLL